MIFITLFCRYLATYYSEVHFVVDDSIDLLQTVIDIVCNPTHNLFTRSSVTLFCA